MPYSGNAVLTEFFDRIELDDVPYLVVTGVVDDPQYLNGRFITTEQFKLEPDASKWNPTPCEDPRPRSRPSTPTASNLGSPISRLAHLS